MRAILSTIILAMLLCCTTLNAQYLWGLQSVGDSQITGNNLAVDTDGNMYVVGEMDGSVNFSGIVIGDNGGNSFMHGYVAKYDADGVIQWVRGIKGNSNNEMPGVAVAADGYVYVCGSYSHTNALTILDFGNIQLEGNISCSGYVAKIDPDGNWLWARRMLATTNTVNQEMEPNEIVVTSENDIIVGGTFTGPVMVDSILYNDVTDSRDKIFFCKLNADGEVLWFRHGEGDWGNQCTVVICPVGGMSMEIDDDDNYYLLAHTLGASYDGDTLVEDFGTGFAVTSFDTDGNLRWWQTLTASGGGGIMGGLTLDDENNVYVGAQKSGFIHIRDDTIIDNILSPVWLFKFNSTGDFIYAKNIYDDYDGLGQGLLHDIIYLPQGYIAAVGGYEPVPVFQSFGPIFFGDTLGGGGFRASFISAYDKEGVYQSVAEISYPDGNDGGEFIPRRMAVDADGIVHMTGRFDEDIMIGDITYAADNIKEMFAMQVDVVGLLDLMTATRDVPFRETLKIFPNPATQLINVQADGIIEQVIIHSVDGIEVKRIRGLNRSFAQIDVSDLIAGTYFLRTVGGEVGRLVVK